MGVSSTLRLCGLGRGELLGLDLADDARRRRRGGRHNPRTFKDRLHQPPQQLDEESEPQRAHVATNLPRQARLATVALSAGSRARAAVVSSSATTPSLEVAQRMVGAAAAAAVSGLSGGADHEGRILVDEDGKCDDGDDGLEGRATHDLAVHVHVGEEGRRERGEGGEHVVVQWRDDVAPQAEADVRRRRGPPETTVSGGAIGESVGCGLG